MKETSIFKKKRGMSQLIEGGHKIWYINSNFSDKCSAKLDVPVGCTVVYFFHDNNQSIRLRRQ